MNRLRLLIVTFPLLLMTACRSMGGGDTIASVRGMRVEIKEEKIEGGLDKAMQGYQRFLEEMPESPLAPEATRRLADLKIEKEYGTLTEDAQPGQPEKAANPAFKLSAPKRTAAGVESPADRSRAESFQAPPRESDEDFMERTTRSLNPPAGPGREEAPVDAADSLERAGPLEAIELYKNLLAKYPLYPRNDQVLYQMSRACEELGRTEEAMAVMERLVRDYPQSRYIDEVQFRRAEFYFSHRKYLEAESAYETIVKLGEASFYYELALYKLGWTFYKQELYDEAQDRFIALLDHKVSAGYDFSQEEDETERKRVDDTFRVVSLGFSNLGGAESVVEYFAGHGKRSYEDRVYSNLAEFYFDKRRYADAAAAYSAFVSRNPFHKKAPNFHMRVIEIHTAGGFPSLVLDAKKAYASTYGLKAEYWKHHDPAARPDVLGNLKTNLTDLAHHYHAAYQKTRKEGEKQAHLKEALHWYRAFLASFPADGESPAINYQLADLLLENNDFGRAAAEYEKTAYAYPAHEKASEAGYAAVYAHRRRFEAAGPDDRDAVRQEVVRSSIRFVDTFPGHEKAAVVLGGAAEDLYAMKDYEKALSAGSRLIRDYPDAGVEVTRNAWMICGHSSYELEKYREAEAAYVQVLALLPAEDPTRAGFVDNLAASIYKQGEQANDARDYRAAADHFLRVGRAAPTSTLRADAEYDAAAALIQLEAWDEAAAVLTAFRENFPGHELQPEATKKIAYVYKEDGRISLAAREYERIEVESSDDAVRRDALLTAAELYARDGNSGKALDVYRRYVAYFPEPVEPNLEARSNVADILKERRERPAYLQELEQIVAIDAAAGSAQTPRTRYLAGNAALVLAENTYDRFRKVRLTEPFKVNLQKKQALMKKAIRAFSGLMDYELGELAAAGTFYTAEIYAHFSKALTTSERPEGLSPLELEQYELAIEEQAYPFEEKAIEVHESNLKLISMGIYNDWVEKSLEKLAVFVPARYDKPEEPSGIIGSLETYVFALSGPASPADGGPLPAAEPAAAIDPPAGEPGHTPAPEANSGSSETTHTEAPEPAEEGKAEAGDGDDTRGETRQGVHDAAVRQDR